MTSKVSSHFHGTEGQRRIQDWVLHSGGYRSESGTIGRCQRNSTLLPVIRVGPYSVSPSRPNAINGCRNTTRFQEFKAWNRVANVFLPLKTIPREQAQQGQCRPQQR